MNPRLKYLFLSSLISIYQAKKQSVPSINFMWQKLSRIIAFGFGSGLVTLLPGTVGTLAGWALFNILMLAKLPLIPFIILIVFCLIIGSWACSQTQQSMNKLDSGHIVFDEWIAIWMCLWFTQAYGFWSQLGVFLIFRLFDMIKPYPIKPIERKMKSHGIYGGFGVMFDDILAGLYTILVIKIF